MEKRGYRIIGDSCVDYANDSRLAEIIRVPLIITLGKKTYIDDEKLDCGELLDDMEKSPEAPKSACPAIGSYIATFGDGTDDIYIVTLSAKVSGSYSAACLAAELFKEEHPDANIHVFNSKSAAAGEITLCIKLREYAEAGYSFASVVEKGEDYISQNTTFFVLETLEVFRKNGRLSHLQSIITSALKIKLVMGRDSEGAISVCGKALTLQSALRKMLTEMAKESLSRLELPSLAVITECAAEKRAEMLRENIINECGISDVVICRAGGISTIYANRGGVIVSF